VSCFKDFVALSTFRYKEELGCGCRIRYGVGIFSSHIYHSKTLCECCEYFLI
jgi:hypothetical protein